MSQAALSNSPGPTIPISTSEPAGLEQQNAGAISMLLKSPQNFGKLVSEDQVSYRVSLVLFGAAVGFYALYGLAMGAYTSGNALWMSTLKAPLILVASLLLCSPSLYMLICLSGTAITWRQATAMMTGVACLSSLLMVGFAPVAWLFGVSTNNLQFMVVLHIVVWGLGLACGLRVLSIAVQGGYRQHKPMIVWTVLFLVVSAQMLTYFRPVLSVSPTGVFREPEKKFFFAHFFDSMSGKQAGMVPQQLESAPPPDPAPMLTPDYSPPAPSSLPMSN